MRIIWTTWIICIILSFSYIEKYALNTHKETLSMYVWMLTQSWPPIEFILGIIIGGLAVHFWWHWMPPGAISQG